MEAESSEIDYTGRAKEILGFSRWWQIVAAAGMMAAVSPYQYVWSSIEGPLSENLDIALPALGAVFSFYVVFQSLSQMPAGWWRDKRGPQNLTYLAAVLAGGGYIGLAYATTLWQLYVLYSLGSIGVGIIYTVAVNTAVKWFPDRTGLTTGIGTMAFAGGSALVVPYVRANATVGGYTDVLRNVGFVILVVLIVGAVLLHDPPENWLDRDGDGEQTDESDLAASLRGTAYTTREMLRTWQFWLLYAMFIATASADLIVIANVVRFAEHFGLAAIVATIAATVLPIAAGVSRRTVPVRARWNRNREQQRRLRCHGRRGDVLFIAAVRLLPVGGGRLLWLEALLKQLRRPLHREGRRRCLRRDGNRRARRGVRLGADAHTRRCARGRRWTRRVRPASAVRIRTRRQRNRRLTGLAETIDSVGRELSDRSYWSICQASV